MISNSPVRISMPPPSSNVNAPSSNNYGSTTQSTNHAASNNLRLRDCCNFFSFSMTGIASILGLFIAQIVTKLATGEKSEPLEKAILYTSAAYSVAVFGYICCIAGSSTSSGGSSSYRGGSSSATDPSYYYFAGSDSYDSHHADAGGGDFGGVGDA